LPWPLAHLAYGEQLVNAGPTYRSMKMEGDRIRLTFDNCGGGLMLGRPPWIAPSRQPASALLEGFGVAGEDRNFVWAKASVEGDSVVVSSAQCPNQSR